MFNILKNFFFVLIAICCGCAGVENRLHQAKLIASTGHMLPVVVKTSSFELMGYIRNDSPGSPLVVYIEGDGFAWVNRRTVSGDPTPKNPLALKLAVKDRSPNVAYLARPCQFIRQKKLCSSIYWTSARFAPRVIKSFGEALDQLKAKTSAKKIHLVGYSGGGAIAALLAEQRSDVFSLRTVAGNLDHRALNRHHKVSQLKNSLNPIDLAMLLKDIPQLHYVGMDDKIVPGFIASRFIAAQGGSDKCALIIKVKASHNKGWDKNWPALLQKNQPMCKK